MPKSAKCLQQLLLAAAYVVQSQTIIKTQYFQIYVENDEKRKSSFCFNSSLQKFSNFIPHLTRLMSLYPTTNLVYFPTSLLVP